MNVVAGSLVNTKGEEFLAELKECQLLKNDFATLCMLEIMTFWDMTPRSLENP
jgi:hypothetical protein